MKWHNLGITILYWNVFWKLLENHITTDFICVTSPNFVTTSHINYWNQVNSWKKLQKFWNGTLCRNKSGPFPLLDVAAYWKSSNNEVCANTDIERGRGGGGVLLVSEIMSQAKRRWITEFTYFSILINNRVGGEVA